VCLINIERLICGDIHIISNGLFPRLNDTLALYQDSINIYYAILCTKPTHIIIFEGSRF